MVSLKALFVYCFIKTAVNFAESLSHLLWRPFHYFLSENFHFHRTLDSKYLLECLAVLRSESLEFNFKDRLSPGILYGAEEKSHTYVIMPMRI